MICSNFICIGDITVLTIDNLAAYVDFRDNEKPAIQKLERFLNPLNKVSNTGIINCITGCFVKDCCDNFHLMVILTVVE